MMRLGALIAVIFAVGVAAGYVMAPDKEIAEPVKPAAVPVADSGKSDTLRADLDRLQRERDQLALHNAEMEQELAVLRADQALMDEVLEDAAAAKAEGGPATAAQPNRGPSRGDVWGRRGGGPPPTPEQMAEMRKNFEAQRQQWQQRIDDQITGMNDPNAVANYQSLIDLQQRQDELRRAMREAKTDEERQKLEAQYEAVSQSARDTLYAQQNAMLQNLAATSGIQDSAAQQKFVEELRATLSNPFFRMEPMLLGGRGPRGFGGGPPRAAGN